MQHRLWTSLLLAIFSPFALAATIEKPVWSNFKGAAASENRILGYVQFGQLPDGSPAIQKINSTTVRYYERSLLLTGFDNLFMVDELNCSTGMLQPIGAGSLNRITALSNPPAAYSVKSANPKDLSVYRELCTSVGIQPSW